MARGALGGAKSQADARRTNYSGSARPLTGHGYRYAGPVIRRVLLSSGNNGGREALHHLKRIATEVTQFSKSKCVW